MATKDDVVNCIKKWMSIDRELKVLQKEIKVRREQKKEAAEALVTIMKENELKRLLEVPATRHRYPTRKEDHKQ